MGMGVDVLSLSLSFGEAAMEGSVPIGGHVSGYLLGEGNVFVNAQV